MSHRLFLRGFFACVAGLLLTAGVQAQSFRTYLSRAGDDMSPTCGLSAPCRLLPAALALVADGGEVWMLDSANYNTSPVNIDKSVTILAVPGALGSVVALGGNAINIAAPGKEVALRNLVIVPYLGSGGSGVVMTSGTALTIENCLIANLSGYGIYAVGVSLRVTDTTIRDNDSVGIYVRDGARAVVTRALITGNVGYGVFVVGSGGTTTTADIADSTLNNNSNGISAYSEIASAVVRVSLVNSRVVQNSTIGVVAQSTASAPVTLTASNNVVSNNNTGIAVAGTGSRLLASGNAVSDNETGLSQYAGGVFESAGDNAVRNNAVPTSGTVTPVSKL